MLWRPQDHIMGMQKLKVISLKDLKLIDMVFFKIPIIALIGNIQKKCIYNIYVNIIVEIFENIYMIYFKTCLQY